MLDFRRTLDALQMEGNDQKSEKLFNSRACEPNKVAATNAYVPIVIVCFCKRNETNASAEKKKKHTQKLIIEIMDKQKQEDG